MSEAPNDKTFRLPANFFSYLPVLNETEIRIYLEFLSQTDSVETTRSLRPWGLAKELGVGLKTINRALKRLERLGLISRWPTKNNYIASRIQIRYPGKEKEQAAGSTAVPRNGHFEAPLPDIQARRDLLVQDIGRTLGDFGNLSLYRALCRIYTEPAIRQALSEVRQTPDSQIKKSKTALFLYLLKKHANG